MEKNKLKELIIEHKEKFLRSQNLIKREIQKEILKYINQKEIIILTGIRRSGKSSLLKLISNDIISNFNIPKSNLLYINFEDERLIDFTVKDFNTLYETFLEIENPKGKKIFFLDEIQNIENWEKWVNRMYEFEDIKFFITGSNSKILGSNISTSLTGRNRQVINFPFSFKEYLSFKNIEFDEKSLYTSEKKAEIKRSFKEYTMLGGFPEVVKNSDISILEQYFKDIIYYDIIARKSIKKIKEIKETALLLASNIATKQSYENIKNITKIKSLTTVKNYFEIFNEVFLFFFVNLFDFSIKRQIYNPSKVYIIDSGLYNSISFKTSQNIGRIYENIIFLELKRRNKEIFYWKSQKNKEVDFIVKKANSLESAIQVSFSISDKNTFDREVDALIEAKKHLNIKNLLIITDDEEEQIKVKNTKIQIIPIWKWLIFEY